MWTAAGFIATSLFLTPCYVKSNNDVLHSINKKKCIHFIVIQYNYFQGGCSSVVEHWTADLEVPG